MAELAFVIFHIYSAGPKVSKNTQKRTKKKVPELKISNQKSNEAQKITQKSKFTQKCTQSINELNKIK